MRYRIKVIEKNNGEILYVPQNKTFKIRTKEYIAVIISILTIIFIIIVIVFIISRIRWKDMSRQPFANKEDAERIIEESKKAEIEKEESKKKKKELEYQNKVKKVKYIYQ